MTIPADCVECYPFNPAIIPVIIVEFALAIIMIITNILVVKKAIEQKRFTSVALALFYFCTVCSILVPLIANAQAWILDYYLPWSLFVNPATFLLGIVGTSFFCLFGSNIFWKDSHRGILAMYLAIGFFAAVMITLPQNNWGIEIQSNWEVAAGAQTFRLWSEAIALIYVLIPMAIVARGAFHTASLFDESSSVPDLMEKQKFRLIGFGSVIIIISMLCNVIEALISDIYAVPVITVSLRILTWAITAAGMFLFYVSFCKPAWWKRRYEKSGNREIMKEGEIVRTSGGG